jgi:hypothetical protein
MSHREIRELSAELEPRPDVAASIRKLPVRPAAAAPTSLQLGAPRVECDAIKVESGFRESNAVQRESSAPAPARPALVEPLAPGRYQVRFTASLELREKLERLQALMRSSVPDGDLARIIEVAVSEKLERVEAKRFGRTRAPRSHPAETDSTPASRHIPAAVRRLVHARDGGRCTYRDAYGRRCDERHDLEFHHKQPFARGDVPHPQHAPGRAGLWRGRHVTLPSGDEPRGRSSRRVRGSDRGPTAAPGLGMTGERRELGAPKTGYGSVKAT